MPPPPLYAPHAAVQLQPIHALRLACGAQRALVPVAVSTMNIHDVRDRRQTDRRQTKASLNSPPIRGGGLETCVTWVTSVPILVFLGLSVLDLGPMYATDIRQTASSLNAPAFRGRGHNKRAKKRFVFVSGILYKCAWRNLVTSSLYITWRWYFGWLVGV